MSEVIELLPAPPRRHPDWIRVRAPIGAEYTRLKGLVRTLDLHTVCEEALCPNIGECWGAGTLTIMILGDMCTRACRFCAVTTGSPRGIVDADEPRRVADAIAALDLNYVVVTSVDRDDLPDQGAGIFAQTVREIKARTPRTMARLKVSEIERLIYPVSFYRHKARHVKATCHLLVERFAGKVPGTMEDLLTLPGVGRKTAQL